jgi:hypothetical protein
MKKMSQTKQTILILMGLVVLCLCGLFFIIIPTVGFSDIPVSAPSISPATTTPKVPLSPTPLQHKEISSGTQCRQYVRAELLVPSSAQFSNEKTYKIDEKPLNYHAVTGLVTAQNRFGVPLRSTYRCDVHYIPEDPSRWILDSLTID